MNVINSLLSHAPRLIIAQRALRLKSGLLTICFLLATVQIASADYNYFPPHSAALGGAGVAAVSGSEVNFMNPAALVHAPGYFFSGAYSTQSLSDGTEFRDWSATISDNEPDQYFPASLSYLKRTRTSRIGESLVTDDWRLALAKFMFPKFSLGLMPVRQAVSFKNSEPEVKYNATLGALWTPGPDLGLGLVFYNFLNAYSEATQPSVALGLNYLYKDLMRVRLDLHALEKDNPDRKAVICLGVESVTLDGFFFRAGYRKDDLTATNFVTGGLGWDGPKIGLNYAIEKNANSTGEYRHYVDLRIYF